MIGILGRMTIKLSAYEAARRRGAIVFYEAATDTIRTCPENYCLASRVDGRWTPYVDPAIGGTHKRDVVGVIAVNRRLGTPELVAELRGVVRRWRVVTADKKYVVDYAQDEYGWWVATSKDVPGCHTQGETREQARERIREAIALFTDQREVDVVLSDD